MEIERFYTYLWLREDGTPYYVGKGHAWRAFSKHSRGLLPPDRSRILVQEWDTEHDAFEAEKLLIAIYGRKDNKTGCLRNFTDGGEGAAGAVRTEAFRKRVGEFWKGRIFSPEYREKIRLGNLGKVMSPEARKKMSISQSARKIRGPHSTKTRAKIAAALSGRPHSEERKRRIGEGRRNSPLNRGSNVK